MTARPSSWSATRRTLPVAASTVVTRSSLSEDCETTRSVVPRPVSDASWLKVPLASTSSPLRAGSAATGCFQTVRPEPL